MSRTTDRRTKQLRQLSLTHAREALRDRRSIVLLLATFGGMSIGLAVLDLLIAWNTDTQLPGVLMGVGIVANSLPLLALIGFASLAFVGTAVPLATYRATGVLRQLGTTPVSRSRFILTHLPIRITLGIAQMVVVLVLAALFATPTAAALGRASVLMLSALVFLLAVGYLIGARFQDPDRALAFAFILIIVLIATSGTAMPLAVVPDTVSAILSWLPTTLFTQSLSSEMVATPPASLPFEAVALLLLGSALALFALASRSFRWGLAGTCSPAPTDNYFSTPLTSIPLGSRRSLTNI